MNGHVPTGSISEYPAGNFVSRPGLLSLFPEYREFFSLDYTTTTYYTLKKKLMLTNFENIK